MRPNTWADDTPRFGADRSHQQRLSAAFLAAVGSGEFSRITDLLTEDATLWADGGGKVGGAATRPVVGAQPIARFSLGLAARFPQLSALSADRQIINGQWAVVLSVDTAVIAIMAFETDGERISGISNVVNPEKPRLRALDV